MEINRIRKHPEDIIVAVENIEASTIGIEPQHYNNYEINWIVERGIEIIAEALKRILSIDPGISITNTHKIIATRNKITHEYDVIDHYQLFLIVTKYLPILKQEADTILNSKQA